MLILFKIGCLDKENFYKRNRPFYGYYLALNQAQAEADAKESYAHELGCDPPDMDILEVYQVSFERRQQNTPSLIRAYIDILESDKSILVYADADQIYVIDRAWQLKPGQTLIYEGLTKSFDITLLHNL